MKLSIKLFTYMLWLTVLLGPSSGNAVQKGATSMDRTWDGKFEGHSRDCPVTPGSTCRYSVIIDVNTPTFSDGVWHITGSIAAPFTQTLNDGTITTSDDLAFIFPDQMTFDIDATDFPGVPALHVDLSNIPVDGGNWSVDVPQP